jgi:ATP-dependent 26S proteasome regulatory subunit
MWQDSSAIVNAIGDDQDRADLWQQVLLPAMSGVRVFQLHTIDDLRLMNIAKTLLQVNNELEHFTVYTHSQQGPFETIEGEDPPWEATTGPDFFPQVIHAIERDHGRVVLFKDFDHMLMRPDVTSAITLLASPSKPRPPTEDVDVHGATDADPPPSGPPSILLIHTTSMYDDAQNRRQPPSLQGDVPYWSIPLPRLTTLKLAVNAAFDDEGAPGPNDQQLDTLALALRGVQASEASRAIRQMLVVHRNRPFSDEAVKFLSELRQRTIESIGLMEFEQPTKTFADIGGLNRLVEDLRLRQSEFSSEAADAGLMPPKGVLLAGPPGVGKTLIGKAISGEWGLPMLSFNMSSVLGQYVGTSEKNIRDVLNTAETLAPCVLFIDELDKALAGMNGGGDGGTTKRVIGSFLTWLNDRTEPVYVVATANNLREAADTMPELLRKGRWDDVWWVALPTVDVCVEIAQIHLNSLPPGRLSPGLGEMLEHIFQSEQAKGISGAEVASTVFEANRRSFHDGGRSITEEDLRASLPSATLANTPLMARAIMDSERVVDAFARKAHES